MNDLSPAAKAIIEAGVASDEPTGADRDRVRRAIAARVGLGIAAGAVVGTAATKATATVGSTAAAASSATVTSAAVGGAGTVIGTKAVFSSVAAKVMLGVVLAGGGGAAIFEATSAPTSPAPRVGSSAVTTATVTPARAAPASPPAHAVAISEAPRVDVVEEQPAVAPTPHERAPALSAKPVAGNVPPRPLAESTLAEEARLLREANEAIQNGQPGVALDRLAQHERSYPNGLLTEERAGQRVLALCAAGRDTEAKGLARSFLSHYPQSPYVSRVEGSCAGLVAKP